MNESYSGDEKCLVTSLLSLSPRPNFIRRFENFH